ncbi:hypothetical protein TNCV_2727811 [Trichonephila clavipes]|nr:hypothetical protein TNCV_2727811 [Trichonephila clavipes]
MKQDLEKAENAYLSSFTSKKSKTLPGATAAAHGDPNGKNDYQKRSEFNINLRFCEAECSLLELDKQLVTSCILFEENSDKGVWEIDTAATSHFCNDKSLFLDLKPIINMKMSLATEDKSCPVEGIGTLRFRVENHRYLHLKPFGCLAYAGAPKQIVKKKFDMRAKMGIMMRYAQRTKGYRIWLIDENKLVETLLIVKDSLTSRLVSKTSTETPSTSEKPGVSSDNHNLIPCTEVKWIRNIEKIIPNPRDFQICQSNKKLLRLSNYSNCYKQAIRSIDASKWHDAMDKEINVMMERKVWDLVDHPDNIKILENRWVYTIKYNENNKIVRYKARLVARGNTQLRGESFDEVFQEYKLELSKVKSLKLRCYSESDFATNRDDRVSMGGFITFIDETPIS